MVQQSRNEPGFGPAVTDQTKVRSEIARPNLRFGRFGPIMLDRTKVWSETAGPYLRFGRFGPSMLDRTYRFGQRPLDQTSDLEGSVRVCLTEPIGSVRDHWTKPQIWKVRSDTAGPNIGSVRRSQTKPSEFEVWS